MKRVLLVTYDFPPVGGPGVQRAAWPKALAFAGLVASLLVLNHGAPCGRSLLDARRRRHARSGTDDRWLTVSAASRRLAYTLAPYLSYEPRPVERLRLVRGEIRLSAFLRLAGGGGRSAHRRGAGHHDPLQR